MAGWSILKNGSALDSADIVKGYQDSIYCAENDQIVKDSSVVDDSDDCYGVKLRLLFDQVLSVFLNEAAGRGYFRPMPVFLGDGQSLDLFELFWVVKKRGGFDMVNGFWTFVVKELGLDVRVSPLVKLVYFKYLYELEGWSRSYKDEKSGNGECQSGGIFGCLSSELERELRRSLSSGYDPEGNDDMLTSSKYKKNGKYIDRDVGKSERCLLETKDVHSLCNGVSNRCSDDDEKFHDTGIQYGNDIEKDLMNLDPSTAKKEIKSHKRKRQSLSEMVSWVIQIAKCPDHPLIGKMLPISKWKDHGGNGLWIQAVRARDALLQKRKLDSNIEQILFLNNQKMHPSIYEDVCLLSEQSEERLRSCSAPQSKVMSTPKTQFENGLKNQASVGHDLSAKTTSCPSMDEHFQVDVAVGPRFQADVPKWTGMIRESDSKWLGTRLWPSEYGGHNPSVEMDPIGKGRPDLCGCRLPGSVECVRFHVAERRVKLKIELGPLFYCWRFDRMGEEVSLRWTAEEEKRFKDMVRYNPPSLGKCFWDHAHKCFPRKTRDELVSYYFNVFLVQRRSYQNRVTPKNIDSDDEDSEFGSLSDGYGHEAVKIPGDNMLICSENKQCTDFR